MLQLVIGNKNFSSWSLRPWLLLKQAGLPFDEIHVKLRQPDTTAQILRYSPSGKVPALLDGDLVVWDSLAICEYVAELAAVRGVALWPADPKTRAEARAVSAEMHSGFMELRGRMPMNCRAEGRVIQHDEALDKDIERIQAIWTECRLRYGQSGPWLFGHFTIADAMFAPVAFRFNTYGIECQGLAGEYLQRMLQDEDMQAWLHAAQQEQTVIMSYETGLTAQ